MSEVWVKRRGGEMVRGRVVKYPYIREAARRMGYNFSYLWRVLEGKPHFKGRPGLVEEYWEMVERVAKDEAERARKGMAIGALVGAYGVRYGMDAYSRTWRDAYRCGYRNAVREKGDLALAIIKRYKPEAAVEEIEGWVVRDMKVVEEEEKEMDGEVDGEATLPGYENEGKDGGE